MKKVTLGCVAKDTITGFEGVVVSVNEQIDGTVQMKLQPHKLNKDGGITKPEWIDSGRLVWVSKGNDIAKLSKITFGFVGGPGE